MAQVVKMPPDKQPISLVSEETHLRDYLHIIHKRLFIILSVLVSSVIGTALYVLMQQPIYESTISLLIEPTGPNVMSKAVEEVYAPIDVNFDYYKTQYEILKSYEIMRETVKRLNLKTHPEYGPQPASPLDFWFGDVKTTVETNLNSMVVTPAGPQALGPESEAERLLVDAFRGHVKVSPVLNSRIVHVTVESIDPRLAAQAATTIASVYITR